MKKLPEIFTKNKYEHRIIWRDSDYCITEVRDEDTKKVYCLEVFEIQKYPETKIKDTIIEAREATPSNEDWGTKGFTVHTMVQAELKVGMMRSNKQNSKRK